jgi:hypothetical protein
VDCLSFCLMNEGCRSSPRFAAHRELDNEVASAGRLSQPPGINQPFAARIEGLFLIVFPHDLERCPSNREIESVTMNRRSK